MENTSENKVGAGIITISVITFIGIGFSILGYISLLLLNDALSSAFTSAGVEQPSNFAIILSLILTLVELVSVILILKKNVIGVYGYFATIALSFIYNIITAGFSFSLILGLILPILMAVFISQKKHLYFN